MALIVRYCLLFYFVFRAFLASIKLVDDIVSQVEQIVNEYYGDGQTMFVFTSDHGVTQTGKSLNIIILLLSEGSTFLVVANEDIVL